MFTENLQFFTFPFSHYNINMYKTTSSNLKRVALVWGLVLRSTIGEIYPILFSNIAEF